MAVHICPGRHQGVHLLRNYRFMVGAGRFSRPFFLRLFVEFRDVAAKAPFPDKHQLLNADTAIP